MTFTAIWNAEDLFRFPFYLFHFWLVIMQMYKLYKCTSDEITIPSLEYDMLDESSHWMTDNGKKIWSTNDNPLLWINNIYFRFQIHVCCAVYDSELENYPLLFCSVRQRNPKENCTNFEKAFNWKYSVVIHRWTDIMNSHTAFFLAKIVNNTIAWINFQL